MSTASLQTENYWKLVCGASNEVKLRLIDKLTKSLLSGYSRNEEKKRLDKTVYQLAGKWSGDESAEEIIALIEEGRKNPSEPVSFD